MNLLFLFQAGSTAPIFILAAIGGLLFIGLIAFGWDFFDRNYADPQLLKVAECFKMQAGQRDGAIEEGTSKLSPKLIFCHDDIDFTISVRRGGKPLPNATYLTFQTAMLPDKNFRIAAGQFKALISFTRIKNYYNEKFCAKYDLEGNSSKLIGELLTDEIQDDLLNYQKPLEIRFGVHRSSFMNLKAAPGRFYLIVAGYAAADEDYDRLIGTGFKFYEQLKNISAAADRTAGLTIF